MNDIRGLGSESAQSGIMAQVGVSMLAKSLKGEEQQSSDLLKIFGQPAPLAEGSGTKIDLLA